MVIDNCEKSARAWEAVHAFVGSAIVAIVDGKPTERKQDALNGTGTILRTPGGAALLLTARHVLQRSSRPAEDGFCLAAKDPTRGGVGHAIMTTFFHPDEAADTDVAIGILSSEAVQVFGRFALPTGVVATSGDFQVAERDVAIIAGFPKAYMSERVEHGRRLIWQEYGSVTYATTVERMDEKQRYQLHWGEAVAEDNGHLHRLGARAGEVFELKHPGGVSGGPLWRFGGGLPNDEVWSPQKIGRIIGIAEAYRAPNGFAQSVRRWGDWFHQTVQRIDNASPRGES